MDILIERLVLGYEANNSYAMVMYASLIALAFFCMAYWQIYLRRIDRESKVADDKNGKVVEELIRDGRLFRNLLMEYRDAAADVLSRKTLDGLDPNALKKIDYKLKDCLGRVGALINIAKQGREIDDDEYERFIAVGNRIASVSVAYQMAVESRGASKEVDYLYVLLTQGPQLSINSMMNIGVMEIHLGNSRVRNDFKTPGGFVADASSEFFEEISFAIMLVSKAEIFLIRSHA